MGDIARMIISNGRVTCGVAESQLAGIPAGRFARFSEPGGRRIVSNHPAFVFGHLCLYPARAVALVGLEANPLAVPEAYGDLFEFQKECLDDPEGSIYPPMDEIVETYRDRHTKALEILEAVPNDVLLGEHPDEQRRRRFPTIGTMVMFYFNNHPMLHLGQVSAWRRAEGLGPAS